VKLITKYNKFLESIQTKDMWDIIPQSVKDLNELFKEQGKKLYLVGGSVRDFLTGDKPKDFDLATDALPDEVIDIVGKTYRTNLQGKAFGVVVVFTKEVPEGMEIATFREDTSKGRNPEVKLGVTIEDDVKRRDLTYNSLFYDLDKREIVDLVGGKGDLEAGITRMVGDPIERFDEDSLRILRAFRFASRYEHPLHKDTEAAIAKRKQLENIDLETGEMKRISQERVWEEIKKAWKQAKDFNFYLNFFTKFDMWDQVFPGANINTDFVKSSDFVVVIANLFKNEPLNRLETKLVQDYKIEGDIAKKVIFLLSFNTLTPETAFEMFKKKEQCFITDTTILEWIKVSSINDPVKIKFLEYKPSTSAEELMAKGITGRELGLEIKRLEIENFKKLL
jgi:tRNA nucleotidyltransferase/poly(A) polymerase